MVTDSSSNGTYQFSSYNDIEETIMEKSATSSEKKSSLKVDYHCENTGRAIIEMVKIEI